MSFLPYGAKLVTFPVTLADYRTLAKRRLSKEVFDYIDSGAGDEITKHNNRKAFCDIGLRPFCLKDVSKIDTSLDLLEERISLPIIIAPMAFHQLVDKDGEVSTAKAAKWHTIPMVVSMMSNISLEEISQQSMNDNLWMQVYIFKNRAITEKLIKRAESAGYKAILITVGIPQIGKRDRNIRNQFSLPIDLPLGNFKEVDMGLAPLSISDFVNTELDPSLTWKDIEWVKTITKLPIILKGIMNPGDAEEACRCNVSGIIVSNHGGRQLDTTEATISVLPEIVNRVRDRMLVMLDSSIWRGTDILKAIALGAHAILVGRPVLWALAINGEVGVRDMLNLLREEFSLSMKLSGCPTISEINSTILSGQL